MGKGQFSVLHWGFGKREKLVPTVLARVALAPLDAVPLGFSLTSRTHAQAVVNTVEHLIQHSVIVGVTLEEVSVFKWFWSDHCLVSLIL